MDHESSEDRQFHEEILRRAMPQYRDGYYGDAVFNAFKVVEEALREALGVQGGTARELIRDAFKPEAGRLHAPEALNDERTALLNLFQGAFGYFRNPHGHSFPAISRSTAYRQLILADLLLDIVL